MLNVITLADVIRRVVSRALNDDVKTSPAFIDQNEMIGWISDGYREIVRRTHLLTATYAADLIAGGFQPPPSDILDRTVWHEGALRILSNGAYVPLIERAYEYLVRKYPGPTTTPGTPTDWGWDESGHADTPELVLLPPPPALVADGLRLDYVRDPGQLTRLYDDDTATASVTNLSPTVTLPVHLEPYLEVGDAFGVKATAEGLPLRWYRITSIAAYPDITLSEAYAGPTSAAALFTLSQVSLLEWKRPALVRYAAAEFALAEYLQRQEGEQGAQAQRQRFDSECQRILVDMGKRPGLKPQRPNIMQHAGARSRMGI